MTETAQTDDKAASDPEHVALNVDIPAGEETFTELHDVSFVCLTGFAPCPFGSITCICSLHVATGMQACLVMLERDVKM